MILTNPNAGIALQTARGADIPNDQYQDFDQAEWQKAMMFEQKYAGSIQRRADPTGIYNCHGLTFASRRAWLFDPTFLPKILTDDGYVSVNTQHVLPGDVILYIGATGEIDHSGIVVTVPNEFGIPKVCSKWGYNAEFVHWANATPYGSNWQFWRVRR